MIQVLTQDAIRQHVDRVEPACVADMFALSELQLSGALGVDLRGWAARATRELEDLPEGAPREEFLALLAEVPAADIPETLRVIVRAMGDTASPDTAARVAALDATWTETPPAAVVLPVAAAKAAPRVTTGVSDRATTVEQARAKKAPSAPKAPKAAKTPARDVDPRRAEWIRTDAVTRLATPEYAERGLKESILLAGIQHRSPYTDLTIEEIKVELRKLERERRLKHTGERWLTR